MNYRTSRGVVGLALAGIFLGAAPARAQAPAHEHAATAGITHAVAPLHPTQGSHVRGLVTFQKVDHGMKVTARIEGLSPGLHGFHIHEWGDCSAPDGTSAGGHFNPTGAPHASPEAEKRHVGDLGNLTANEEGVATYERVDEQLSLEGINGILGRGVIVHEKADDLTSQPTGAAGGRVACGVIGVAKP